MDRIGSDVERELGRFGPQAGMSKVVQAWPGAVGEGVARNAWPARIASDGTLHVHTSSAAWAFELTQLAPTVLGQLRAVLGSGTPRALRFAAGRLPEAADTSVENRPGRAPQPTAQELSAAHSLAAPVDNAELRELLERAAAASLARARSDR
jgi:Dna[CI] antecedent, DciA